MKKEDIIVAHRCSSNHRELILASDVCGCFYCLSIFSSSEIEHWVDAQEDEADINETGQTALCSHCGIDSVLGSASGYPINREFLQKRWTEMGTRDGDVVHNDHNPRQSSEFFS